jgi:hypothetical protein
MKLFLLGAVLLLMSAASLADTPPATPPSGGGNSCSKDASGTCKGCSITCPEEKAAVCTEGLYNWNADRCTRDATCVCKVKKRKGV